MFRKIQSPSSGLNTYYPNHIEASRILRQIMALPLLPPKDIKLQFHELLFDINHIHDTQVRRLLRRFHRNYVFDFWMKKIGPDRISVYALPHKSNNAVESLHANMGRTMPNNPSFYHYMDSLRTNITVPTSIQLQQIENGMNVTVSCTNKREKLSRYECTFIIGKFMYILRFLGNVQYLLHN